MAEAGLYNPKGSANVLIHRTLCPRIACLSSPDVQQVLEPNGFADLAECLQPFEESVRGVTVRTSQLESKQCYSFPVRFEPLSNFATGEEFETTQSRLQRRSLHPEEMLDDINARVTVNSRTWDIQVPQPDPLDPDQLSKVRKASIEELTPWFAEARDRILQSSSISRHETFGHPAAILLAVSNLSPDPLNAFASLYAATQPDACQAFTARPYVDSNILRYYVLIHDVSHSSDLSESISLLESVKKIYGLDCCVLAINSAQGGGDALSTRTAELWKYNLRPVPTPSSAFRDLQGGQNRSTERGGLELARLLDNEDIKRLRAFVRELVAQSLIPWMERCVLHWNDSVAASRKGLTGRLFGARRKLFGQSSHKGTSAHERLNWNASAGYYWSSAFEAQTRRLADFAFTLHDYKLAATTYDLGRKDYAADKAHRYVAGATEMFGLSHLMMMIESKSSPIDVDSYLASSHTLYCSASVDADTIFRLLRSTLLYYEAYRALSFYRPAPAALLRTAQGPGGSDIVVLSAMLLEQAAYAYLKDESRTAALRKWALHLAMAGQRYQQSGAKMLCQRCFLGAQGIYARFSVLPKSFAEDAEAEVVPLAEDGKENVNRWPQIEAHMYHQLGKQALNDGNAERAIEYLLQTLRPLVPFPSCGSNPISEGDQRFREIHAGYLMDFVSAYDAAVSDKGDDEALEAPHPFFDVANAHFEPSSISKDARIENGHKPARIFAGHSFGDDGSSRQLQEQSTSVGEQVILQLRAVNPICSPLTLAELYVEFVDASTGTVSTGVEAQAKPSIELSPLEAVNVPVTIASKNVGRFRAHRLTYRLQGRVLMAQTLHKQGRRLNQTVEQRKSCRAIYAEDESLVVKVVDAAPSLSVSFSLPLPLKLSLGEEVRVPLILENTGSASIAGLEVLTSNAEAVFIVGIGHRDEPINISEVSNALVAAKPTALLSGDATLQPGESLDSTAWLRGASLGIIDLQVLFIYTDTAGQRSKVTWSHRLEVRPSLDVGIDVKPSASGFAYTLAINAVNLTPESTAVQINQVRFLSPRWKSEHSPLQEDVPGVNFEAFAALAPEQPRTAYVDITEAGTSDMEEAMEYTREQLRAQLCGRDIQRDAAPGCIQLYSSVGDTRDLPDRTNHPTDVGPLFFAARTSWRHRQLRSAFPTISKTDRQRIFTLYQPDDLDVIVEWQTNAITDQGVEAEPRRGRVFIFGLSLGPSYNRILAVLKEAEMIGVRAMYEETAQEKAALLSSLKQSSLAAEEDPVMVNIEVPKDLSRQAKLIEVTFRVRNMSTNRHASCVIDLDSAVDPDAFRQVGVVGEVNKASWVGRLTLRVEAIPPKETRLLRAQAIRPTLPSTVRSASTDSDSLARNASQQAFSSAQPAAQPQSFLLGDWSIKVDVWADAPGRTDCPTSSRDPIAHFNSGRLSSGRFIAV